MESGLLRALLSRRKNVNAIQQILIERAMTLARKKLAYSIIAPSVNGKMILITELTEF